MLSFDYPACLCALGTEGRPFSMGSEGSSCEPDSVRSALCWNYVHSFRVLSSLFLPGDLMLPSQSERSLGKELLPEERTSAGAFALCMPARQGGQGIRNLLPNGGNITRAEALAAWPQRSWPGHLVQHGQGCPCGEKQMPTWTWGCRPAENTAWVVIIFLMVFQ